MKKEIIIGGFWIFGGGLSVLIALLTHCGPGVAVIIGVVCGYGGVTIGIIVTNKMESRMESKKAIEDFDKRIDEITAEFNRKV